MAVEFKGIREVTTNGGTSIQIQIPAEAIEDDLLICYIAKDGNVAIYNTGDYSNWNMLFNIISDSQTCLYIAWRIATADDVSGAVSWTWNADSEDWVGEILCYRGADTTTPIPHSGSDYLDSSATPTAPSVAFTDLPAGSLILQVFGCDFDDTPRVMAMQLTSRFNAHQANDIGGAGGDKVDLYVSPTGHTPDSGWTDESNAYDENVLLRSRNLTDPESWGNYLELTIDAISCNKVRFWAMYAVNSITQISVDVYYSSAWHNIYAGAFANREWVEKAIGSTETVTAMRVKFYNTYTSPIYADLYEADFLKVGIQGSGNTGTAVFGIPASNEWTAATLVIGAASAAGIFYQAVAGVFSATGAITKLPKISLAGVLTSTGSLARKTLLNLAGSFGLTGIVSSIFKFPKSLAGTFGLTGTIGKLPKISLAGVFGLTGTIVKLPKIILSGVFSPTGTVSSVWKSFQSLAGSFNLTGNVVKLPKITLGGAFDFTGSIARKILISLSGAFDFIGSGVGQLIGGLFYKTIEGAFSFTGGVSTVLTKFKSLAGSFDFSGSLNRLTKKVLSGSFDFIGSVVIKQFKSLSGVFSLTGSIGKLIKKTLSGVLSSSGSLNKLSKILLSGSFNFTGGITTVKRVFKALAGSFNFTGSLGILTKKILSGTFDFTGNVARKILISLSGAFDFVGDLSSSFIGFFYKTLGGTMTLTGDLNRLSKISLSGVLTASGNLLKLVKVSLAGVFGLIGTLGGIKRFVKVIAGVFGFSGTLGRLIKKTLSGSLTFSGFLKFRTFWNKVIKVIGTYGKVDKSDKGWFKQGWFTDWLAGILYRKVNKNTGDFTKVSKDTSDFTKVNKMKGEWDEVEK